MQEHKVHSWESLRGDALGEDTAMRVLYSVVSALIRWLFQRRSKRTAADEC